MSVTRNFCCIIALGILLIHRIVVVERLGPGSTLRFQTFTVIAMEVTNAVF
jgi:hypothetical protein